jgi:polysaccharide export outer membrane protein
MSDSTIQAEPIRRRATAVLVTMLAALLLSACAGPQRTGDDAMTVAEFQNQYGSPTRGPDIEQVNQQILTAAVNAEASDGVYRLGPGDQITVDVFGVEDLSGDYRIDGMGRISVPLIGNVEVSGYTLAETEQVLEQRYGDQYLRDPQITVSVLEFRSQQFTAVGAVARPQVYNTERKITLIEALAMAGGLGENAGHTVYLTDRIRNPETGDLGTRSLAIAVEDLSQGRSDVNVVLGEQALINVPQAGSVYVEGAVESPGVYRQRGGATVLKAIAMAGGLRFEAKRNTIHVLRRNTETGEWEQDTVAMDQIRASPNNDIALADGDIVVVETGMIRATWIGLWNGLARIAMLGFRPLGP